MDTPLRKPIDVGAIGEIVHLARQIMAPTVRYSDDPLVMAHLVIAANSEAARRILETLKAAGAIDDASELS